VVVTVLGGCGAIIVVVRSVVVVCVVGDEPQAASKAVPPSNIAANPSRVPDLVLIMQSLPICSTPKSGGLPRRTGPADPTLPLLGAGRRAGYWVLVVVLVFLVVVTATGGG
jgi:hypothetical protein